MTGFVMTGLQCGVSNGLLEIFGSGCGVEQV